MASTSQPPLQVKTVAIIGAGVSGIASAVYLTKAGLDVTVFERSAHVGGVWFFDNRTPKDASYPSIKPSVGDSPEYETRVRQSSSSSDSGDVRRATRHDSPVSGTDGEDSNHGTKPSRFGSLEDARLAFAPPGPCYEGLRNNVSTTEMEMRCQSWKAETEDFVSQSVLADYLHEAALANDVYGRIRFDTRVENVVEADGAAGGWEIDTTTLISDIADGEETPRFESKRQLFDSVVVASGHYHAPNIPGIPGLAAWKAAFPDRITHSKLYRRPSEFKDQNVLLIGAGTSSMDIARELGSVARNVYQSSRGGKFDLPAHLLPANATRVSGVVGFEPLNQQSTDSSIPGAVILADGRRICNLHRVIVCTGYHVSLPFLRHLHADGLTSSEANDTVLVTDGQQTHNLHKDIFYIPKPTLAFVGVPYHTATFSCFEFQAMALAAVLSGRVNLPSEAYMRESYNARLQKKGAGRTFHSLKGVGKEIAYVEELVDMVNASSWITGHSERWLEAYERRVMRQKQLFGTVRDPTLDEAVLARMSVCS